ncbi:hypothetical protein [Caulobacter vibrioides]|uniref:Uncharacterized protein n=1 Tax=Caulobacter vibrioides (strain NA1000 / CB15N) TaxID=565050 RepID=A0A0H3CA46_CAUVN|nr:hypothetical protein [Caulobacter vibrioides]YP_002518214.1 hypothetical protein CCNA_02841 [Caulobacter vibrioides NA1000]QBQ57310.1 hypothetical protein EUX21_02960 [synthetic Caulobacter sp. 'ethensis']ACL96306.1 hypothetical protein CCNA_02841 [Caulobacter vibrioides NA1000]ATC29589.1 hypothetical protein CA607_14865 [Caulobacter vibrioides]QXZ51110.1 hypothetical protein KZH45_14630 [Caulobacter vibrioides]
MVQLSREGTTTLRTCGGRMGPAHEARDDGGVEFWNGGRSDAPSVSLRIRSDPPPPQAGQEGCGFLLTRSAGEVACGKAA